MKTSMSVVIPEINKDYHSSGLKRTNTITSQLLESLPSCLLQMLNLHTKAKTGFYIVEVTEATIARRLISQDIFTAKKAQDNWDILAGHLSWY